jgi:spore germination cell wall hydrolase CwlJ-like protein
MKTLTPVQSSSINNDAQALHRELEIDTLARTIWGEARGEGSFGMAGVACVIINRVRTAKAKGEYWWGNSVIQICQKPYQFSCWNKDDPNYRALLAVDGRDLEFATALRIARRAMAGALSDQTGGATHYHAAGASPYWTKGFRPCAVIGRHIFYKCE